jgi:hypothetical protein
MGPCTIVPQRVLWYADDHLVGVTEQTIAPRYAGSITQ